MNFYDMFIFELAKSACLFLELLPLFLKLRNILLITHADGTCRIVTFRHPSHKEFFDGYTLIKCRVVPNICITEAALTEQFLYFIFSTL